MAPAHAPRRGPTERRFDDIYNACEHERSERSELGLLDPAEAYDYVAHVRERCSGGCRRAPSR